jgi:small redox-active disulfide protein 2
MKLQVLGPGCPKCHALAVHAGVALKSLGLEADVEKVEDIRTIAAMGVMATPALAVDGKVVSAGKVLSSAEIAELIERRESGFGIREPAPTPTPDSRFPR